MSSVGATHNYFGFDGWNADRGYNSVVSNFRTDDTPEPEFVYAVYSTPAYEGCANIVYRQNGKWFHASGSHCSCYGLEGQWEPEEIDPRDHLAAVAAGKAILLVADTENDYSEATQENFNAWLEWAAARP